MVVLDGGDMCSGGGHMWSGGGDMCLDGGDMCLDGGDMCSGFGGGMDLEGGCRTGVYGTPGYVFALTSEATTPRAKRERRHGDAA